MKLTQKQLDNSMIITRAIPKSQIEKSGREKRREKRKLNRKNK